AGDSARSGPGEKGTGYRVSGIGYQGLEERPRVLGTGYSGEVPGTGYRVLGKSPKPGTRSRSHLHPKYPVPGTQYLFIPGPWSLVPGTWSLPSIIRPRRIFDHKSRRQASDLAGQACELDRPQHLVEVLVGRGGLVARVGAA